MHAYGSKGRDSDGKSSPEGLKREAGRPALLEIRGWQTGTTHATVGTIKLPNRESLSFAHRVSVC